MDVLESFYLRLWKIIVHWVAVVKYRMNDRSGDSTGSSDVKIRTNTAKFTNMIIARWKMLSVTFYQISFHMMGFRCPWRFISLFLFYFLCYYIHCRHLACSTFNSSSFLPFWDFSITPPPHPGDPWNKLNKIFATEVRKCFTNAYKLWNSFLFVTTRAASYHLLQLPPDPATCFWMRADTDTRVTINYASCY